ncbi:MAG: type II toxin-antitoxin system VapC family toxin [Mycobacteriales bacterium]
MIVLDTTVLVYATGTEHPLRGPCRRLVQAVADGALEATTTVEVVQEFVHVRARRRSRSEAAELGAAYADLLAPLLPVTSVDLLAGLRVYRNSDRLGASDAVLAAAAMANSAAALVSADAAFGEVAGLTHLVPDADSVRALLDA